MKLIYCKKCQDIVRLDTDPRKCGCGKSSGCYIDDLRAEIKGPCIPIGIDNRSFCVAVTRRPQSGLGSRFEAFVIPMECPTVEVKP